MDIFFVSDWRTNKRFLRVRVECRELNSLLNTLHNRYWIHKNTATSREKIA